MSGAKCAACGAAIIWARTQRGRSMPVDARPTPAGNVVLERRHNGLHARVMAGGLFDGIYQGERHMPHHATCPHAAHLRKGDNEQ